MDKDANALKATPPSIDCGLTVQILLDALPFYVILVDAQHTILQVNAAVTKNFGMAPASLIGKYCPKAIHGLDHAFPGCPLEEARSSGCSKESMLFDAEHGTWLKSSVHPTATSTPEGHRIFVHLAEDVTETQAVKEELLLNVNIQAALNDLLRLSGTNAPIDDLLQQVLERIISLPWLAVERKGAIFLADEKSGTLSMHAQTSLHQALLTACHEVPYGWCLCGRAAATRTIQFADSVDERHDARYDGIKPHGHYCIPLLKGDHVLGVLNVYLAPGHVCNAHEESFLRAAAEVLVGLIEKQRAHDTLTETLARLRKILGGIIDLMASVVESKDPYTAGHQRRVSDLARSIATEMGLPSEEVEGIRTAGLIHDLGKIAIPAEILSKPGRLTALEYQLIQTHVSVAYELLKPIQFPWPIANAVAQHHERLDGSGYPAQLKGDAIGVPGRVLAVADVVESMASHRPYRPALGMDRALEEIQRGRGTQYDPNAVDACLRLFREKAYSLRGSINEPSVV
ncbi:MAG: HD domain-containing protein [Candidatus Atribacteria bacterium]|nr:HD domain-containing protein [Candidatus Atribacteria bacterium]